MLSLISNSKGTPELPVDAKTQLNAKHKYHEKLEDLTDTRTSLGQFYDTEIAFYPFEGDAFEFSNTNRSLKVKYNTNWIISNLDYPTLFNNYIYLFGFTDTKMRWNYITEKMSKDNFEQLIGLHGKREYLTGIIFNLYQSMILGEMQGYYSVLLQNGITIEETVKWFFSEYLPNEFNVFGFIFNEPTKEASYLEKCRDLVIEIDSILKQYKFYCRDGKIDRELFEISTEQMVIGNIPSQIKDKYYYPYGTDIAYVFRLLFSNQSLMFYKTDWIGEGKTAYEILQKRKINLHDLEEYQINDVKFLVSKQIFSLDDNQVIIYDYRLLQLLYDLYQNSFGCTSYCKKYADQLCFLEKSKMIHYGTSLISEPEQNYFNYLRLHQEVWAGMSL